MDLHQLRVLAGLPTGRLVEKHGHYEPVSHPQQDVPMHEPAGGKGGSDSPPVKSIKSEDKTADSVPDLGTVDGPKKPAKDGEEPLFPEMIMALAAKAEGLTGDELAGMVDKIYQAGVKDGLTQAEEGKEPKKDVKKDDEEGDDEDVPNIDKATKE